MGDWLKQNKAIVGIIFTGVSGAVATCDPFLAGKLHSIGLSCESVSWGLSLIGSFLVGAGILESDATHRDITSNPANKKD